MGSNKSSWSSWILTHAHTHESSWSSWIYTNTNSPHEPPAFTHSVSITGVCRSTPAFFFFFQCEFSRTHACLASILANWSISPALVVTFLILGILLVWIGCCLIVGLMWISLTISTLSVFPHMVVCVSSLGQCYVGSVQSLCLFKIALIFIIESYVLLKWRWFIDVHSNTLGGHRILENLA